VPTQQTELGYAYSSDGVTWTKSSSNPVLSLGGAGTWEDHLIGPGTVRFDPTQGRYYLLYWGCRAPDVLGSSCQIGQATFSNPEGSYARNPDNPILGHRTSAEQDLRADLIVGNALATVAHTSVFAVDEPVVLVDSSGEAPRTQTNQVQAIIDATHLALRDAAERTFHAARQGAVRSAMLESISNNSWWQDGTTWRMTVTGFQMVGDYKLSREYGVFAVLATPTPGPTPTGTREPACASTAWEWDYAGGYIIEPSSSSTWDQSSAENFSLVQAAAPTLMATPTFTPTPTPRPLAAPDFS